MFVFEIFWKAKLLIAWGQSCFDWPMRLIEFSANSSKLSNFVKYNLWFVFWIVGIVLWYIWRFELLLLLDVLTFLSCHHSSSVLFTHFYKICLFWLVGNCLRHTSLRSFFVLLRTARPISRLFYSQPSIFYTLKLDPTRFVLFSLMRIHV